MTVKDFIEKLQKADQNKQVACDDGAGNARSVRMVDLNGKNDEGEDAVVIYID